MKWHDDQLEHYPRLPNALQERINKCYHAAMSPAYVIDPVYWRPNLDSTGYAPDMQQIAGLGKNVGKDIWCNAKQVCL